MKKLFNLTQSGIDELKLELKELQTRRVAVSEAVKVAREMGDLKENSEYQSSRQELERTDNRIDELEHVLANVQVITSKSAKQIALGSTVTLKGGKKDLKLQVVGTIEADPVAAKISDESPIGKALIGKKEGDEVEIQLPSGTNTYTIASIA